MTRRVFFSSVGGSLTETRLKLHEWATGRGYTPFTSEKSRPDLDPRNVPYAQIAHVCLDEVASADLYIGIFYHGYGGSFAYHVGKIGLTDLEFFEAFRSGKAIRCYVVNHPKRDPELDVLLDIAQAILPNAFVECDEHELLGRIKRDVDEYFDPSAQRSLKRGLAAMFDRYFKHLVRVRHPLELEGGIRFLGDKYPVSGTTGIDRRDISARIARASDLSSHDARLNEIWTILPALYPTPWRSDRANRALWDEALSVWSKSAAWRRLHGPMLVGKLAADNTLLCVRSLIASDGEILTLQDLLAAGAMSRYGRTEEWARLYGTGGALASEYYSIGKAIALRRRHYLNKAGAWVRVARRTLDIEYDPVQDAGLCSIHGHILLALGRLTDGIGELERCIDLHRNARSPVSVVAEITGDIGYAHFLSGRLGRAEAMIMEGVRGLERAMNPAFASRIKRKAAEFYLATGRLESAAQQIREADAICLMYGIAPQSERFPRAVRKALGLSRRPKLRVIETPNGFEYVEVEVD